MGYVQRAAGGVVRLEPASLRSRHPCQGAPVLALLLALAACSCARTLPTAPSGLANHSRPGQGTSSSDLDNTVREVVVTLADNVDPAAFGLEYGAQLVDSTDWRGFSYVPGLGESPDSLASQIRTDPRVISAERNAYIETAETRQQSLAFDDGLGSAQACADQPAMQYLNVSSAWRVSTGQGIRVAILDTGAELTHPALAGRIVGGWDFVGRDADPTDEPDGLDNNHNGLVDEAYGHGTHVAGIIARIAPSASLLIVRVLDADGRGSILDVASGIRWAIDHGARVINLSLGMTDPSPTIENLLTEAEQRGIVCVAAAGNWGADSP